MSALTRCAALLASGWVFRREGFAWRGMCRGKRGVYVNHATIRRAIERGIAQQIGDRVYALIAANDNGAHP